MAAQPGELFVCDRSAVCHASGETPAVFMIEGDKRRDDWKEVEWEDTNSVKIKTFLCPECLETYNKIRKLQQNQTQDFMYEHLYPSR